MYDMYLTMGSIVVILIIFMLQRNRLSWRFRTRLSVLQIWCIGIILWPLIWKTMVGKYIVREESWVGLIWPISFLVMEMTTIRRHDPYDRKTNRGVLTMDANGICSLTFALSGILGAQRRASEYSSIFIAAIVCCLAFVLPSPHSLSNTSNESIIIEAIQKVFLTYSTGLLLTGVLLMSAHSKYSDVLVV